VQTKWVGKLESKVLDRARVAVKEGAVAWREGQIVGGRVDDAETAVIFVEMASSFDVMSNCF